MLRGRTLAKVLAVSIIAILTISAVMLSGGSGGDVASRNSLPSEGVGDQTTLSSLISAPGVENVLNSGRPFKLNDLLVAVPTLRQTRVTMDIDAGPALGVEAAESIENQNQDRNDSVDGDPSVPEDHVTIAAATSALLAARLVNLTQASVNPDIVKELRIKKTNSSLPSGLIETGVTLRTGVSSSSANRTADPTETDDSMALATAALQKQVAQALAEADIALKTKQANPPQSRRNRKSSSARDSIRPGSRIKGQNPGNRVINIPEKYKKVELDLKKGSLLIFHSHLIHGSTKNITQDKWRPILLMAYALKGMDFRQGRSAKRKPIDLQN